MNHANQKLLERIKAWDVMHFHQINSWSGMRSAFFTTFTHVANHHTWEAIIMVLILYSWLAQNPVTWSIVKHCIANVFSILVIGIFKLIINRARPYRELENVVIRTPMKYHKGPSFPSGHTQFILSNMLIITRIVSYQFPAWTGILLVATITISVLIAISRVHVGVHYPTDVIAGLGSGIIIFILTITIMFPWVNGIFKWIRDLFL